MQYQKPRRSISHQTLWLFCVGFLIGVAIVHLRDDIIATLSGPRIARSDAELYSEPPRSGSRQVATSATAELKTQNSQDEKRQTSTWKLGQIQITEDCGENERALNCFEVCAKEQLECDVDALESLNTKAAVKNAAASVGYRCEKLLAVNWPGAWDGPWIFGKECGYNDNENWAASCDLQPACGFMRICACKKQQPSSRGAAEALQVQPTSGSDALPSQPTETSEVEKSSAANARYVQAGTCSEDESQSQSCDETCEKIDSECDIDRLSGINSESFMKEVTKNLGIRCHVFLEVQHVGAWDGPWVTGDRCAFNAHEKWEPSCDLKPACGFQRICACRARKPTSEGATKSPLAIELVQPTLDDTPPQASAQYSGPVVVNADCGDDQKGLSCVDACGREGLECDKEALTTFNTARAVRIAAQSVGLQCEKTTKIKYPGIWDGPWLFGGDCSFNTDLNWKPRCDVKPSCGYARLCACKGTRPSLTGELPEYITGGPVWPVGAASSYPWELAKDRPYRVPGRMTGLQETIYSRSRPSEKAVCGKPCVAHCVAGQPRDMISTPGMVKAIRYRLVEKMSDAAITLAVLVASGMMSNGGKEGDVNYARASIGGTPDRTIEPVFKMLAVDRGLVLREKCTTMPCLRRAAGFACNARDLGIVNFVNKSGFINNICDVQFRRFQTCVNMVREYEKDHSIEVNWITRQRPDVYWVRPAGLVASMAADAVYMHSWAACGYGGADWFYMAPRKFADVLARFPDEMTCSILKHPKILPNPCKTCLGCECMVMAWLIENKVPVKTMPFNDCAPGKFCTGNCPRDWEVTPRSIAMR